ncbi:MAG TPA: TlyA family RNA methyltransferase [Acidobacteriota bacterium]|nr:TlyA family RNA methyltransferase [Acidobacteriota bacterium]
MSKQRLDQLLLARELASNQREAAALIMRGLIQVDGRTVTKAGTLIPETSHIKVRDWKERYVSRGGHKLEGALKILRVDVKDRVCVDLGSSTGGFTDCLLQHGARKVYAFDVGRGQLDWRLRNDSRVTLDEDVNVRYLRREDLPEPIDLFTVDLSFISLTRILKALKLFPQSLFLLLVKPQFEAERHEVGPGGLILETDLQCQIVDRFKKKVLAEGFHVLGECPSPVKGQRGNQEYFLLLALKRDAFNNSPNTRPATGRSL